MTEPKFEEALSKLEKLVEDLESGKFGLEESLRKYEEGIKLCAVCSKKLETARKKVETLKKSGDKFVLEPFDEEAAEEKVSEDAPKPKQRKSKKDAQNAGGLF